ncbi:MULTISPECIES: prolipoprotein diacylglyceryl transferase [Thermoanaerobacterium]|uniref:prolipoprotein diacylglyceryl transferase n=1 Tax=Thermoanaerobacterium TaxID=28895 RepID=UPI00237FF058|nr:prolipoprotein diacylglyceryl transferase [Thermoanaerobacterium sp. R66]MDE4541193.1 prolipoprotein diacylglyceryl transferase [Thermoanaerobacterium sp. R66]
MTVPLFNIGGFTIYLFGIMIAIGVGTGYILALKEAKRKGLDVDKVSEFLVYLIIVGIIGGRLGFVLTYRPYFFLTHPLEILKIHDGGMAIHGSLVAGILFSIWYVRKYKLNFWKIADLASPGLAIGQAIGRIGCDIFGYAMARPWPWGIKVNGQLLHPVQVYEFLLDYIMFFVLWRKRDKIKYNGQLFIIYVIFFNINRSIVEFFRAGNPMILPPFTIAHLASAIFIAAALIAAHYIKKYNTIEKDEMPVQSKKGFLDIAVVVLLMAISTVFFYYIH